MATIDPSQMPPTTDTTDPNSFLFKFNNGFTGSIELIVYLVMFAMFTSILITNQSITQNINEGNIANITGVTSNNNIIQYLCAAGLLFCLIRIVWSNKFYCPSKTCRVLELVFSVLVWGLFIAALVYILINKNKLEKPGVTGDAQTIALCKKQIQFETIYSGVGIALSTLYTVYNIIYISD